MGGAAAGLASRFSADRASLVEKVGMGPGTNEDDKTGLAGIVQLVGQQKIATDMAFPMPIPITPQRVVEPFRAQGAFVGNQ